MVAYIHRKSRIIVQIENANKSTHEIGIVPAIK